MKKETSLLQNRGYTFNPLWNKLPSLKDNDINLSIIIPVYISERFISKCLDSLVNQVTNYTYELICINDGSTDESLHILEGYALTNPEKLIIYSQENGGISKARNKGIELARGEYVGFVDNDDYVSDNYVETIMQEAYKYKADVVQVGNVEVDLSGHVKKRISKGNHLLNQTDDEGRFHYVQGYIWGGCLKKELFTKVIFPEGFWYEDMITRNAIMHFANIIRIIDDVLYYKTVHSNNASKVLWRKGNIKSADQYWLAKSLSDYVLSDKNVSKNLVYNVLLREWSLLLYIRTFALDTKLRKEIFLLCASYLASLKNESIVFYAKDNKIFSKIFSKRSFLRWRFYSFWKLLLSRFL